MARKKERKRFCAFGSSFPTASLYSRIIFNETLYGSVPKSSVPISIKCDERGKMKTAIKDIKK